MTPILRPTQPIPVEDGGESAAGILTASDHREMIEIAFNHADHLSQHHEKIAGVESAVASFQHPETIGDFVSALDAALT